jgi:hypothetical protein
MTQPLVVLACRVLETMLKLPGGEIKQDMFLNLR